MSNDKGKKRGGFYWREFNGKPRPYISVTQIKEVINVPMLTTWQMQQVYRAFLADPSLQEKEALLAPLQALRKAASRGSLVHSIMEAYKTSGFEEPEVKPEYRGYVDAFYKYVKELPPHQIILREATLYSDTLGIAGTFDWLMQIDETQKIILDDFKTSKDTYPENWLQLSAYEALLKEDREIEVSDIRNIILKEDGNYMVAPAERCFPVFLSVLELWKWRNKDLLKQIGWFGGEKSEL